MQDKLSLLKGSKTYNLELLIQPIISYKDKCVFAYECLSIVKEDISGDIQDNEEFFRELCESEFELLAFKQIRFLSIYESELSGCLISINIPLSLMMKLGFLESLAIKSKLSIAVEITDIDFNLDEIELVYERMKYLKAKLNISFWLDDYTINKVSQEFLMYLPWDIIKIDKSASKSKSNLLVNLIYIVNLGFDLQENVIVEGIENLSTHEEIVRHNLKAQGYLYGKPDTVSNYIRFKSSHVDRLINIRA